MDVFLEMLSKNLTITLLIIIPIGLLLLGITIIYIIAFFQGRSISFYPPQIGELPSSSKKSTSKNTDSLQKEINFPQGKIGITAFYNMEDQLMQHKRNEDTKSIIEQGNTFSLLAFSGASYINPDIKRHWDILKPKIENGTPFNILLLNPFSKEKLVRDKLNGITTPSDPKFRLDLLVNAYNQYPAIKIRITNYNIYCSLFFSEKDLVFDPYHLGKVGDRIENNFFALKLTNTTESGDYYKILKKHFEYIWSNSEEFEVFLKKQKNSFLPQYGVINLRSR